MENYSQSADTSEETVSETAESGKSEKSSATPPPAAAATPVDISSLPEVPTEVPYLIIGAGTAAVTAFKAIGSHDLGAKVRNKLFSCTCQYITHF